jgi:hypothetical protein
MFVSPFARMKTERTEKEQRGLSKIGSDEEVPLTTFLS